MRERGVQSRRARSGPVIPARQPAPTRSGAANYWQALAIIALIAATAGWTTVAVLALRDPSPAAVAAPSDEFDPDSTEEPSLPPLADTHDAPELEAVLPASLGDTTFQFQSWVGSGFLTDDAFSTSLNAFLTENGKTAADLHAAEAYDPTQDLDCIIRVFRVAGVDGAATRDALLDAWKGEFPEMTVSEVTLDGRTVTKGGFGEDSIASYLYVRDELAYDIETGDEAIATAAVKAIDDALASGSPVPSSSPAVSAAPSAAPS